MRRYTSLLAILSASFIGGCSLYHVGAFNQNKPDGIPFFAVAGACSHQTVRAVPYFLITLKVTGTSGMISTDAVKLSTSGHASIQFTTLLEELEKNQPVLTAVQDAWDALKAKQPFDPYTNSDGEFLLSNTSKLVPVVDYAHPYSLKQHAPLAGSASADYKINADGTLSEIQAQAQDNTLSTILAALPFSNLIQSAVGISSKAAGTQQAVQTVEVHFSLVQEERMLTRTYSVTEAYTANCLVKAALIAATDGVSVVVADAGANDASAKAQATKDDSSIGIIGTITLPKGFLQPAPNSNPNPPSGAKGGSGNGQSGGAQNSGATKPTDKKKNSSNFD